MGESPQIAAFGQMLETVSTLPPSKRYITTHNKEGKSVVHSSPPQLFRGHPSVGGVARSFASPGLPAKMENDQDIDAYLAKEGPTSHSGTNIVSTTGSNLNVIELVPGGSSQMHRTVSLDYVICTNGHVRMELDTGEFIDLFPGDHVVQRGTLHKWHNPSDTEPTRFIAVILPCEPFEIPGTNGKVLAEEHIEGSEEKGWDVKQLE
jgi:hypothetical protein